MLFFVKKLFFFRNVDNLYIFFFYFKVGKRNDLLRLFFFYLINLWSFDFVIGDLSFIKCVIYILVLI